MALHALYGISLGGNFHWEEDAYDDINLCVFCVVGIGSGALIDYFWCVAFVLWRPAALLLYQQNNHAFLSASRC